MAATKVCLPRLAVGLQGLLAGRMDPRVMYPFMTFFSPSAWREFGVRPGVSLLACRALGINADDVFFYIILHSFLTMVF